MSDDRYRQQLTPPTESAVIPTAGQVADKRPVVPSKSSVGIKSTPHFTVTAMGIQAATGATESEYETLGEGLVAVVKSLPWIWGDFMVIGSDMQWGAYKRIAGELEIEWRTLQEYAYVCRNVHLSLRNDKLSFSHHRAVADLYDEDSPVETREQQRLALAYAIEHKLTVAKFREILGNSVIEMSEPVQSAEAKTESPAAIVATPLPFYERPIDRLHQEFLRKWKKAAAEDRHEALARLKALVKELEKLK